VQFGSRGKAKASYRSKRREFVTPGGTETADDVDSLTLRLSFSGRYRSSIVSAYRREWLDTGMFFAGLGALASWCRGMAYAGIVGVPADHGPLHNSPGAHRYALLGTSRQLVVGP